MHKFFAKTAFLGKNIIYLPDCHSTNGLLSQYVKERQVKAGTILVTDFQTAGRGQRGNSWQSARGLNLLFSVYVQPQDLIVQKQYLINLVTALAMVEAIDYYSDFGAGLEIKWPNDLYLYDKKLGGILVETQLSGKTLEHVIIGVGVNVGQRDFGEVAATSLSAEGVTVDQWELLESFALRLEEYLSLVVQDQEESIRKAYLERLRWLNESHTFQTTEGSKYFTGCISGIDALGRLIVESQGQDQIFDIQQIKFIS